MLPLQLQKKFNEITNQLQKKIVTCNGNCIVSNELFSFSAHIIFQFNLNITNVYL